MKQTLVISDSKTKLRIHSTYLVAKSANKDTIIAYRYIKELYLNKLIDISMADSIYLAKIFKIYFIDQHGYILAQVALSEKV